MRLQLKLSVRKSKKFCRTRKMLSPCHHLSPSLETSMVSSLMLLNYLELVAKCPTPTIFSWETMSIEEQPLLRLSLTWSFSNFASQTGFTCWEEITNRAKSPKSTASRSSVSVNTAALSSGSSSQTYLITCPWRPLWMVKYSACMQACPHLYRTSMT